MNSCIKYTKRFVVAGAPEQSRQLAHFSKGFIILTKEIRLPDKQKIE
jgi:hypothetical protein